MTPDQNQPTRAERLAAELRAMAEECQSGLQTGKSARWALTMQNAADMLLRLEGKPAPRGDTRIG